jgi:very-short-patch-repair endonuclease
MAHMHVLIKAYQRFKVDKGVGGEPACVTEMVEKIVETADPRISKATEFLDEHVNFRPRRTPAFAGRKYFAWIPEKDLLASFWRWYRDYAIEDNIEFSRTVDKDKNTKTAWKAVIKATMHAKGRMLRTIHPLVGERQGEINAYDMVAFVDASILHRTPTDTSSASERRFRQMLETTSRLAFEYGVRPRWLRNPLSGHAMELDMWSARRKLAIEYDGPHHYEFPNTYHATVEEFEAQCARDAAKDAACAAAGVRLIRVRASPVGDTDAEVADCMRALSCNPNNSACAH